MTFREVEKRFRILQKRFNSGNLTRDKYLNEVDRLRVKWRDGSTWKPNADDGSWLKWEGNAWRPAAPPVPTVGKRVKHKKQVKQPETLLELGAFLLKKFLIGLLWEIPIGIGVFVATWAFHTFVLVYINQGFWAGSSGSFYTNIFNSIGLNLSAGNPIITLLTSVTDAMLATKGKGTITGTLFWMLLMSLLMGVIVRFFKKGPVNYIGGLFKTPSWAANSLKQKKSTPLSLAFLILGLALGLFMSVIFGAPLLFGSRTLVFLMGLHGLSALFAHLETFTMMVVSIGWSDAQRAFKAGAPRKPVNPAYAVMAHIGITLGLLVGSIAPFLLFCGTVGFLFLFLGGLAVLLIPFMGGKGGAKRAGAQIMLVLIFTALVAIVVVPVYADDGGWQESGGTFENWVHSQGAATAVAQGVPVSAGAVIGAIMGALGAAVAAGAGALGSAAGAGAGAAGAGAGAGAAGAGAGAGAAGGGIKDFSQGTKDIKDLITGFLGTETGGGLLKAGLSKIFGEGKAIQGLKDFLSENAQIFEGGLVKIKDAAKHDDLISSMLNASKNVGKWVKRVGDGCTAVGVIFDAVDNMVKGDSWYYGLGKASGAGAIMAALTEKNPALAAMEFANFLGFGGSKASDCISPTKNITGSYNMLMDKFTDMTNGTNKTGGRISKGDYGENLKNLDTGSKLLADYVENPDSTVGKDLEKFVSTDKTWDDMYTQSNKVWAPPKDAWMPKKIACGAGELTTDAVIKAGELAAKTGQKAGQALSWFSNKVHSLFN